MQVISTLQARGAETSKNGNVRRVLATSISLTLVAWMSLELFF